MLAKNCTSLQFWLLHWKLAEMHMPAIYRSLLSNVTCFPSIPGILQNIPCVTSSPSISGAIFDAAEDFLDETWENSLLYSHRPIEFKVIESEQFSLRYRSLKSDENLRGEWKKEGFWTFGGGPKTDIANGASMSRKWKKKHTGGKQERTRN